MKKIQCAVEEKKIGDGRCLYTAGQISNPKKACSNCFRYQELRELGFDPVKGFPARARTIFAPYLPEGDIDVGRLRAYVSEEEIDIQTFLLLHTSASAFRESGDPFAALRAFVISHKAALYPPVWAIEWLVKALKEYHSSNGTKDLARLLGFRGGKEPVYKKIAEQERDDMLMLDIFRLHKFGGYSVKQAAQMVAARLKKTPDWNKTGWKLRSLTAGTLQKEYSRKWRSVFEKIDGELLEKMTRNFNLKKRSYLKMFSRPSRGN